ncbi:MAG: hypothetical protein WHS83_19055 [Chloroflexus sp.]
MSEMEYNRFLRPEFTFRRSGARQRGCRAHRLGPQTWSLPLTPDGDQAAG